MKFKTSITNVTPDGKEFVRGEDLQKLTENSSFVETIFLTLRGKMPKENETRMLNALLTSAVDHGPGTASGQVSRIVASAKNSMHVSLAAGILAMGERHGSAIQPAMEFFNKHIETKDIENLVKNLKEQKMRIPGYGHAVLAHDHRAGSLFNVAKETGFYGKYCELSQKVYEELNKISSKPLPLNIDGAMASILCEMGFDAKMAKGIFIISRVVGLVAQVHEETINDVGIRRTAPEDITYQGK